MLSRSQHSYLFVRFAFSASSSILNSSNFCCSTEVRAVLRSLPARKLRISSLSSESVLEGGEEEEVVMKEEKEKEEAEEEDRSSGP